MDRELCTHKTTSPPEGVPAAANFHLQVLSKHSNKTNYGETFIVAYIPGDMHQRIFERAVVSFEDHYYRAEIDDSNFERFSRSIRAINTGMEEIRQYYKEHRHTYEYSFCIITVTESEFLLSACGKTYIVAEDGTSRLHEVYMPEEFLDFSEVISGSHQELKHLFLGIGNTGYHQPLSHKLEQLAYSILLATKGRVQLPWLSMSIDFHPAKRADSLPATTPKVTGFLVKAYAELKRHYRSIKSRIISNKNAKNQLPSSTHHQTKPRRTITHRIQSLWTKLWSTYINPNPLRAVIVVGAAVAIIIASIITWNILANNNKTSLEYQKIQNLYTAAQTSKANQDSSNAESQFNQVITLTNSLSSAQKAAINKYASGHKQPTLEELLQNSQLALDEMHNIFRIGATKVFSEANFSYSLLTTTSSQTNLLDPNTGKLIDYLASSKKTSAKTQSSLIAAKELVSSVDVPLSYAITPKSVYQVKPDLSILESRTSATLWPDAQAAATYANNLYFLMPSVGQIYRYRSVGNNQFGPQTNYLKSNDPNLKDAVSFVVGNTIYTTTKTGTIRQYSQNSTQSFSTSQMPQLDNVIQIAYRTSPESLVLLDTKRNSFTFLNIQDNSAIFQKELVVNNTSNITNFSLDEKNNVLLFVSNDGLYSLLLP